MCLRLVANPLKSAVAPKTSGSQQTSDRSFVSVWIMWSGVVLVIRNLDPNLRFHLPRGARVYHLAQGHSDRLLAG